jgi:hypothetical protein
VGLIASASSRSIPSTLRIGASIWRCSVDDLRHSLVRLANGLTKRLRHVRKAIWCRLFGRRSLRFGAGLRVSAMTFGSAPAPSGRACFGRRQHLHRQTLWLRSVAGLARSAMPRQHAAEKGPARPSAVSASGRRNPPGAQCGMGAQAPSSCVLRRERREARPRRPRPASSACRCRPRSGDPFDARG